MKRALVVEDIVPLQQTWKRVLSKMGETPQQTVVDVAGTVEQALRYLKQHTYNVVICDYQLPDGNGGQILDWVRENQPLYIERDRFFFCTGVPAQARQHGDVPFISKPFRPEELEGVSTLLT